MHSNERRKANGRRLEGNGLAARVAQETVGMVLAQAFSLARSAGYQLRVKKIDGVPKDGFPGGRGSTWLDVEVIDGIVKRARLSDERPA